MDFTDVILDTHELNARTIQLCDDVTHTFSLIDHDTLKLELLI